MSIVTSFTQLVQPLAVAMTTPTFNNFLVILAGWVFAPRHTVTTMLQAAGVAGVRHHSAFHRFFSQAKWSTDQVGLLVFGRIVKFLDPREAVMLAVDDTLARKRGLKMFGATMHYDPQLSSRNKTITHWGHNWVVLCVIVKFPWWPDRPISLPVLFRLYLTKAKAKEHRRVYRTRTELAIEILAKLAHSQPERSFHLVCDSAYGGQTMLKSLPKNCHVTSRLLVNARLYEAPPVHQPGQAGRPRVRGDKLPTPLAMLSQRCRRTELRLYG
jgi:hypothetical protein